MICTATSGAELVSYGTADSFKDDVSCPVIAKTYGLTDLLGYAAAPNDISTILLLMWLVFTQIAGIYMLCRFCGFTAWSLNPFGRLLATASSWDEADGDAAMREVSGMKFEWLAGKTPTLQMPDGSVVHFDVDDGIPRKRSAPAADFRSMSAQTVGKADDDVVGIDDTIYCSPSGERWHSDRLCRGLRNAAGGTKPRTRCLICTAPQL